MKSALTAITAADLIFILLLIISGSVDGVVSEIIYYLAFLVPVLLLLSYMKSDKTKSTEKITLLVKRQSIPSCSLLIFPAVGVTLLLAYLTGLFMGLFGVAASTISDTPIYIALLTHALIPAALEEALFRYFPLRILSPHSKRLAVVASALFFSLCHTNLFQIPYAFAAGLIFAYITLHSGSILPSFIIHLINNSLSVVTMLYPDSSVPIYICIGALAAVSAIFMAVYRRRYSDLSFIRERGEDETLSFAPLALIAVSLFLAVTALF